MKRLIKTIFLLLFVVSVVACGGGDSAPADTGSNTSNNGGNGNGNGNGGGNGGGNGAQSFNGFVISEIAKTSETSEPQDINNKNFTFDNNDETAFDAVLN